MDSNLNENTEDKDSNLHNQVLSEINSVPCLDEQSMLKIEFIKKEPVYEETNETTSISNCLIKTEIMDNQENSSDPDDFNNESLLENPMMKCESDNEVSIKNEEITKENSSSLLTSKDEIVRVQELDILKCYLCDAYFTNKLLFKTHMEVHHDGYVKNERYDVNDCRPTSSAKVNGNNRKYKINDIKTSTQLNQYQKMIFTCAICGKRYKTNRSLKAHNLIHLRSECKAKDLKSEILAVNRTQYIPRDLLECLFCGKPFSCAYDLQLHKNNYNAGLTNTCCICDKVFMSSKELKIHRKVHSKSVVCLICNWSFKLKSQLKQHVKVHGNENSFTTNSKFIHRYEKPYLCADCKMTFTRECQLKVHQRIHKLKCEVCMKSFQKVIECNVHKLIHRYEKPYLCADCKMTFTHKRHLKVHQRIHKLKCEVCMKSFQKKIKLNFHQLIHRYEKP